MNKKPLPCIHITDFLNINNNCNIYWVDKDNVLLGSNEFMLNMLKQAYNHESDKDILNQVISSFVTEDIYNVIKAENNLVMSTGKAQQFLNRVVFNETLSTVLLTIKTPTYDENNQINGVFGISHVLSNYNVKELNIEILTERERECVALLVMGKTASDIAKSLKLSVRTVEFYLTNIKEKFDCESKSELIEKILEMGLATYTKTPTSESYSSGVFLPSGNKIKKQNDSGENNK